MSEEIIKILDELGKRLGIAIDWSNQNIVPYLQELIGRFISFKNVQAIIWIVISLIAIGLSIFGLVKLIKWKKSENYDSDTFSDDPLIFLFSVVGVSTVIFAFTITIICNMQGIFQNILLPELTVLEYLQMQI